MLGTGQVWLGTLVGCPENFGSHVNVVTSMFSLLRCTNFVAAASAAWTMSLASRCLRMSWHFFVRTRVTMFMKFLQQCLSILTLHCTIDKGSLVVLSWFGVQPKVFYLGTHGALHTACRCIERKPMSTLLPGGKLVRVSADLRKSLLSSVTDRGVGLSRVDCWCTAIWRENVRSRTQL